MCLSGFTFPNCLGPLTISVSGSGTPSPTGNVTLSISGGKIGSIPITLGSVSHLPPLRLTLHLLSFSCVIFSCCCAPVVKGIN